MRLVEFVKNGVVKFTVEKLAKQLEEQGWERIVADKKPPQALTPEESAKPQRKPRRKNETGK